MKVSIVIPYWNGAEKIKNNLPRVLEVARANKIDEVIASDDASSDESVKIIKTQFSDVILVEREHNGGFSSNVNSALEKATGDLIFLLNSDAVPSKDFLKPVLPHFNNPKVFSVGCNVGGLWTVGKFKDGFFWHEQGSLETDQKLEAHHTLWVSGGSGIFRKEVMRELGGMDTLYNPFYVEDLDLGYRAWKRGYINIWEPESHVEHYQEKGVIETNFSRSTVTSTAERNQLIFTWKNITSENLINQHKKALIKRLTTHPKYGVIFLQAVRRLPEILHKRKIEKQAEKLTDEQVLSIFSDSPV